LCAAKYLALHLLAESECATGRVSEAGWAKGLQQLWLQQ